MTRDLDSNSSLEDVCVSSNFGRFIFFFFALKQKDKERNNLMIQIKKGKALVCVIFWQEGTEG